MLKNAPIIILDEATAFADPDNESRVQAAFSRLSEGKTVIMIAHRLSTVTNVDQIFVICDGRVAECGNSRELLAKRRYIQPYVEKLPDFRAMESNEGSAVI